LHSCGRTEQQFTKRKNVEGWGYKLINLGCKGKSEEQMHGVSDGPLRGDGVTYYDRDVETCDRERLQELQTRKLLALLNKVAKTNPFYRRKWAAVGLTDPRGVQSPRDFFKLPFTTKGELVEDQATNPPFGTNLSIPITRFVRLHQTSGTTGKPLKWLDTVQSWNWWLRCWSYVYKGAGIGPSDRIFMSFSFGPFIGFWTAYEAAEKIGALAIPGGGLESLLRLHSLLENEATVLVCTPTYALRLAQIAAENNIDLVNSPIRKTIHAGEPGASIPATKKQIEASWGAKCFDHTGMTEVGATGFECVAQPGGIHLIESEFIFEVIDPETGSQLPEGKEGELVITNLGRFGMPVFRYRSGDRVKLNYGRCECGRTFARMEGGILGRVDDMIVVRGINVFPSAIENIIRQYSEVEEFQVEVTREKEMNELHLRLELNPSIQSSQAVSSVVKAIANDLHTRLALRVETTVVPAGSLPRFDLKARRFIISAPGRK